MAKFYGDKSRYLLWSEKIYLIGATVYALFLLYILYFILIEHFNYLTNIYGIIAIIIVCGPFIIFCYLLYNYFVTKANKFYHGRKAEGRIYYELLKLPDSYTVVQGIMMENGANIDFLVFGPTGVFTIEVKAHGGNIGYRDGELLLNGRIFAEKNILKQAIGQALYMQKLLEEEVKFVHPIIVFANCFAKVRFGFNLQAHVNVVGVRFLNELITKYNDNLTELQAMRIEKSLIE